MIFSSLVYTIFKVSRKFKGGYGIFNCDGNRCLCVSSHWDQKRTCPISSWRGVKLFAIHWTFMAVNMVRLWSTRLRTNGAFDWRRRKAHAQNDKIAMSQTALQTISVSFDWPVRRFAISTLTRRVHKLKTKPRTTGWSINTNIKSCFLKYNMVRIHF